MPTKIPTREELAQAIRQLHEDTVLSHRFVHGDEQTLVPLGGVDTPSYRKLVADFYDAVAGHLKRAAEEADRAEVAAKEAEGSALDAGQYAPPLTVDGVVDGPHRNLSLKRFVTPEEYAALRAQDALTPGARYLIAKSPEAVEQIDVDERGLPFGLEKPKPIPLAGAAGATAPGTPGQVVLAADNDVSSRDKAQTPAGAQKMINQAVNQAVANGSFGGVELVFAASTTWKTPRKGIYFITIVGGGGGSGGSGAARGRAGIGTTATWRVGGTGGAGGGGGIYAMPFLLEKDVTVTIGIGGGGAGGQRGEGTAGNYSSQRSYGGGGGGGSYVVIKGVQYSVGGGGGGGGGAANPDVQHTINITTPIDGAGKNGHQGTLTTLSIGITGGTGERPDAVGYREEDQTEVRYDYFGGAGGAGGGGDGATAQGGYRGYGAGANATPGNAASSVSSDTPGNGGSNGQQGAVFITY
jgi:hypothetical protein